MLVYSVGHQRILTEEVVPFFERYVMPFSCKRTTFERFREILDMLNRKEHFGMDGMIHVVEKAYEMNPSSKGRQRLRTLTEVRERILRGHTPDAQLILKLG